MALCTNIKSVSISAVNHLLQGLLYSIILWRSGCLSHFCRVSISGYIRTHLAVYGPEIIGGFGLENKSKKTKAVCGLGRTNHGGFRKVRPP